MEKLCVSLPVIVEGKYDKITLSSVIDAHVIVLGGFSVFNAKERQLLLRRLAEEGGVIVLTDADGGGKQLRSFLSGILPPDKVFHLYIPALKGKERRKERAGKAGLLGVEGMSPALLRELFTPFAKDAPPPTRGTLTKADFYRDGLSGTAGAAERRCALAFCAALPPDMTANALLEAINLLYTEEEYLALLETARKQTTVYKSEE